MPHTSRTQAELQFLRQQPLSPPHNEPRWPQHKDKVRKDEDRQYYINCHKNAFVILVNYYFQLYISISLTPTSWPFLHFWKRKGLRHPHKTQYCLKKLNKLRSKIILIQESPYITRTQPGLPPRIDHLLSLFNGKVSQFSSKQQEKRGIAKVSKCNFLGFLHQCTAEE